MNPRRKRRLFLLPVSPVEVRQILDDLARDDQPHNGGHKRGRARDIAPVGTFSGRAGRADAVVAAADGRVLDGADRLFLRIDDLEMRNALFPAELPLCTLLVACPLLVIILAADEATEPGLK